MKLLELLEVDHPILQAPMAGVSTPAMAAAVSNVGALGAIGVGSTDAAGARKMIAAVRERTTRAFHVNVFCHAPAKRDAPREAAWIERLRPRFAEFDASPPEHLSEIYESFIEDDAMLAMLIETKPRVVSFHFGVPSADRIRALKDAGIVLLASATNLAEARAVQAAGVDAIIAQGWEAGGHRGTFDPDAPDEQLGTFALTRLLVARIDRPIIAAGGIMDGAGIAGALALGAGAAQLGTAFVGCDESSADDGYRAALRDARSTVMIRAMSGRPARCIANRLAEIEPSGVPSYPVAYDAAKALNVVAKAKGEHGYGAQLAGQGVPLARALPAADLVRALVDEAPMLRR